MWPIPESRRKRLLAAVERVEAARGVATEKATYGPLLRLLASEPELSVPELSRRLNLSTGRVRGRLAALSDRGFVVVETTRGQRSYRGERRVCTLRLWHLTEAGKSYLQGLEAV
jgi:predicted ArsR family transcriptional regulator